MGYLEIPINTPVFSRCQRFAVSVSLKEKQADSAKDGKRGQQ